MADTNFTKRGAEPHSSHEPPMKTPFQTIPTFLIIVAALFLPSGCGMTKSKAAAEKEVNRFHQQLDNADFKAIYAAAHADFKAASKEKDFIALLEAVHRKLGTVQKSDSAGWRVNSFNLKTNVVLTYHTKFAGGDATETFDYRLDGDSAQLYSYNINSQALITK